MSATSDDYADGARQTLVWLRAVIDNQIAARPPKPAEPTDIGAVVTASQVGECDGSDRTWVRFNSHRADAWIDALGHIRSWSDLENVTK